jgi:hypothetical protein
VARPTQDFPTVEQAEEWLAFCRKALRNAKSAQDLATRQVDEAYEAVVLASRSVQVAIARAERNH